MAQPKQKLTSKSEKNAKQSGTGKKKQESAATQKEAGQISQHKCRVKQEGSTEVEISAEQIDPNSPEADAAVMKSLFEMALSGKNMTATIFWAKARCGMQEKGREKEGQTSQAPTIVIRAEEGKKA